MLRFLHGLALLVFLALVLIFAVYNTQTVNLRFLGWVAPVPVSLVAIGGYVLGMVSGWNVLGFMRKSWREVRRPEE